jgi:hypothetical protein
LVWEANSISGNDAIGVIHCGFLAGMRGARRGSSVPYMSVIRLESELPGLTWMTRASEPLSGGVPAAADVCVGATRGCAALILAGALASVERGADWPAVLGRATFTSLFRLGVSGVPATDGALPLEAATVGALAGSEVESFAGCGRVAFSTSLAAVAGASVEYPFCAGTTGATGEGSGSAAAIWAAFGDATGSEAASCDVTGDATGSAAATCGASGDVTGSPTATFGASGVDDASRSRCGSGLTGSVVGEGDGAAVGAAVSAGTPTVAASSCDTIGTASVLTGALSESAAGATCAARSVLVVSRARIRSFEGGVTARADSAAG